jgi:drug/metabolite transporter (DMT)-like permease
MNAYTLLFLRWTITLLLLTPVVSCTEGWKVPGRKNLLLLGGMGILSVVLGNLFAFEAYKTTTAINIGFIGALGPMLIAFFAFLLLGEKYTVYKIFGSFLAFSGVIISLTHGNFHELIALQFQIGDLYIFLSAAANALYAVIGKYVTRDVGTSSIVLYSSLFGLLVFLPFGYADIQFTGFTQEIALCILYVSVVATLLSRWLYMKSMKFLSASEAGILKNFQPLLTACFAFLFLSQNMDVWHVLGWIVMTGGVVIFYRKKMAV